MKAYLRAACVAACLLLNAAPALAAEAVAVPKPAALLPSAIQPFLAYTPQTLLAASLSQQPSVPVEMATPQTATPVTAARPTVIAAVPLRDLVISYVDRGDQDAERDCLATAVYFEARSEPLEGQLAVAQVVLNRAASGTFPTSICEVVTQPAQFSFVRGGKLPPADRASDCWHRALAIADIARKRTLAGEIASNVLWYHATYVSPSWDRQRTRFAQIGKHIFFS